MRFTKYLIIQLTILLVISHASAASLRLSGKRVTIPETAITFLPFTKSRGVPKTPPLNSLLRSRKNHKKTFECYRARELWFFDQTEVVWGNKDVTILIGKMRNFLPKDLKRINKKYEYIRLDTFLEWKSDNDTKISWDEDDRHRWLEDFCRIDLSETVTEHNLKKLTFQEYKSDSTNDLVFTLDTKRKNEAPIVLHFKFSRKMKKSDRGVVLRLLRSVTLSKVKSKKKIKKFESLSMTPENESKEFRFSRERAFNSISNLDKWWTLESADYIIMSNMKSKKMASELQKRLTASRKAYELLFPLTISLNDISILKLFNDRSEFLAYAGKTHEHSGGFWSSRRQELVVSPPTNASFYDKLKSLRKVVSHEAFHQYIYYALAKKSPSRWFNEGTAVVFEGITTKGPDVFNIHLQKYRHEHFGALLAQKNCSIEKLVHLSPKAFYEEYTKSDNYTVAWALMFYLYKGARVMNKPEYVAIPQNYYNSMLKNNRSSEATEDVWADIDMAQFQKDFEAFWNSPRDIKKAEKLSLYKIAKKDGLKSKDSIAKR